MKSIYSERRDKLKKENRPIKIIADTEMGDDRGDVCTNPSHKHDKEWHHGTEIHPTKGYLTYHISFPYPEKGFKNDYIVQANNIPKRIVISWLRLLVHKWLFPFYLLFLVLPRPWKMNVVNKFLKELLNVVHFFYDNNGYKQIWPQYLDLKAYGPLSRGLKKFGEVFLKSLGVEPNTADLLSFYGATMLEYDSAYVYMLEDLFSTTSKEKMLQNPRGETKKLIETFAERSPMRPKLVEKFKDVGRFIDLILRVPSIKRAFKRGLQEINFEDLQLDEDDRWHVRNMGRYNFFGKSQEERLKEFPFLQHTFFSFNNDLDVDKLTDQDLDRLFGQ